MWWPLTRNMAGKSFFPDAFRDIFEFEDTLLSCEVDRSSPAYSKTCSVFMTQFISRLLVSILEYSIARV